MLHLHLADDFKKFSAPEMARPLERKTITSSPSHSRQRHMPIVMLLPQAGVNHLVTIASVPPWIENKTQ